MVESIQHLSGLRDFLITALQIPPEQYDNLFVFMLAGKITSYSDKFQTEAANNNYYEINYQAKIVFSDCRDSFTSMIGAILNYCAQNKIIMAADNLSFATDIIDENRFDVEFSLDIKEIICLS